MQLSIDLSQQRLELCEHGRRIRQYRISSALNGAGERMGSECTPRGLHRVRAKIGHGQPPGAVFVGRRPTGEIFSQELQQQFPKRDWILSRILWLGGLEPGKNRYGQCDTQARYIYIHGTHEEERLGQAVSHGCIRMANLDVMELFEWVTPGTEVEIHG